MDIEPTKAAAAGATLLDSKYPGWAMEVNAATLRMETFTHCTLGQLYGHYSKGITDLFEWDSSGFDAKAVKHGFYLRTQHDPNRMEKWLALDAAWREEIAKRRLVALPDHEGQSKSEGSPAGV